MPGRSAHMDRVDQHVNRAISEALRGARYRLLVGEVNLEDIDCNILDLNTSLPCHFPRLQTGDKFNVWATDRPLGATGRSSPLFGAAPVPQRDTRLGPKHAQWQGQCHGWHLKKKVVGLRIAKWEAGPNGRACLPTTSTAGGNMGKEQPTCLG